MKNEKNPLISLCSDYTMAGALLKCADTLGLAENVQFQMYGYSFQIHASTTNDAFAYIFHIMSNFGKTTSI